MIIIMNNRLFIQLHLTSPFYFRSVYLFGKLPDCLLFMCRLRQFLGSGNMATYQHVCSTVFSLSGTCFYLVFISFASTHIEHFKCSTFRIVSHVRYNGRYCMKQISIKFPCIIIYIFISHFKLPPLFFIRRSF